MGEMMPQRAWRPWPADRSEFDPLWESLMTFLLDPAVPKKEFPLPPGFDPYQAAEKPRVIGHNLAVLKVFRELVPSGRSVHVLDYHHPCHLFDPSVLAELEATPDEVWGLAPRRPAGYRPLWKVPVVPEGDTVYFYFPEGGWAYGYEWPAETVTAAGAALLEAFARNPSPLLAGR